MGNKLKEVPFKDRMCPFCETVGTIQSRGQRYLKEKNKHVDRYHCKSCDSHWHDDSDFDIIKANVALSKKVQKFQDTNRIERKAFREYARVDNALEEYNSKLISLLEQYDFSRVIKVHKSNKVKAVGVVHISDLHLNELVEIMNNKYDFIVAGKRLNLFADRAIDIFNSQGIKNIIIADTGDKLNSDRRLDELLNQATNRSNATMLAVHLLNQFIVHLAEHFNITYACVTGNESRVKDEMAYSKILATDNYDYTIYNILRYMHKESKINFIIGDPSELIVNINGQNVLMLHGNSIRGDVTKTVTGIKGKYADKGVLIDYVLFGDVHEARIADSYSRSSSMVGDNAYSFNALQLTGRASQNIHIFHSNKNRDSIKIDLQNIEDIEGYDIINELESYNAKSVSKVKQETTIFKVVI